MKIPSAAILPAAVKGNQRIYAPRFNTMNAFKKKATTVSREQIGLKENLGPYSFFIALNHSGSVLFISPTFVQKCPKKEKKKNLW